MTLRKPSRPHVAVSCAWIRPGPAPGYNEQRTAATETLRTTRLSHIKLWDNRVKGWTFALGLKTACPPCSRCPAQNHNVRPTHASTSAERVYLQWKSSFILPSLCRIPARKHWPQERKDQILQANSPKITDLIYSCNTCNNLTKASPSSLDGKWVKGTFNYTHGCVFYLQSPRCWNHN